MQKDGLHVEHEIRLEKGRYNPVYTRESRPYPGRSSGVFRRMKYPYSCKYYLCDEQILSRPSFSTHAHDTRRTHDERPFSS